MAAVIAALPAMHLVCNIVISGGTPPGPSADFNSGVSQPPGHKNQPWTLPEGYVVYPDIGVAYKVADEIVSWHVAKERCARDNAYLAVIDSSLKIQLVRSQKPSINLTYVGIHFMDEFDSWLDTRTGLPIASLPWAHGEPDGTGNCAFIKRGEPGLGRFSCISAGDYVCELPLPKDYNNRGISWA